MRLCGKIGRYSVYIKGTDSGDYMMQKGFALSAYAAAVSAILFLLVTCIDIHCFNRSFYEREYASLKTAEDLNMSHRDLMKATDALLDYLQGKQEHIAAVIEVNGFEREAFNERETQHMVDVLGLYRFALKLRLVSGIVLVASIALLWWKKRSQLWEMLSVAYSQCALGFLLFVGFLAIWATVDFTSLWESFHRLFFTNELWLLNPHTDLMINMFPEVFFFHMVLRITLSFVVCFGLLWAAAFCYGPRLALRQRL